MQMSHLSKAWAVCDLVDAPTLPAALTRLSTLPPAAAAVRVLVEAAAIVLPLRPR